MPPTHMQASFQYLKVYLPHFGDPPNPLQKKTAQLSLVISTVICPFSFSNRGCMPSAIAWFRSICHFVDLLKNNVHYIPLTEGLWNRNTAKERTIEKKYFHMKENRHP